LAFAKAKKPKKATTKGPSASDLGFRRLGFHSFPPTSNNFNSAPKFPPKSPPPASKIQSDVK
jgi:hypothetical protein